MTAQTQTFDVPKLILDPATPLESARKFLAATERDRLPTLRHWRGGFYRWNAAWRPVDNDAIRAQIYDYLDGAITMDNKGRPGRFNPEPRRVSDVADALKAAAHLDAGISPPTWLEHVPDLSPVPQECIVCANGTLHLPSGDLIRPTPRLFTHAALAFEYSRQPPQPAEWLKFLTSLWPDDLECIATLQEWSGYLLTADTRQQKALMLVGPKRSGKGTVARVLRHLVGEINVAAPTLASLGSGFGLQPLIDASLAIIGDARIDARADLSVIAERLLSITGEDCLTIDRKYSAPWTGQMPTRLMLLSNELPHFKDASGALASRFIILTLENSFFGREDHGLLSRILPEMPGILQWAVEGWHRLHRRGYFQQPGSSASAIEDLDALASPVAAFVRDICEIGPDKSVTCEALFEQWKAWCEKQGLKAGATHVFSRNLKSADPRIKTSRPAAPEPGVVRARTFDGIGFQ